MLDPNNILAAGLALLILLLLFSALGMIAWVLRDALRERKRSDHGNRDRPERIAGDPYRSA